MELPLCLKKLILQSRYPITMETLGKIWCSFPILLVQKGLKVRLEKQAHRDQLEQMVLLPQFELVK